MSRTRNKYTDKVYYHFPSSLLDTNNELTNTTASIGQTFQGDDMGEKIKSSFNPMGGTHVTMTVQQIKASSSIDFKKGDLVSENATPNKNELSTIVTAKGKRQNNRGGKANKTNVKDWTLELS